MLKILFSPSESKKSGGNEIERELLGSNSARNEIFNAYIQIVTNNNEESIKSLFGFKKYSECLPYINSLTNTPLMMAIERYRGVAYDYLNYDSLNNNQKKFLQNNTIIFSNLYGPLLGGDTIANYKVKQGNSIGNIAPDKFYKKRFSYQLDLFLAKDEILDLRAGYYDKFYKLTKEYTTLKFLKNGKSVSHWAKAYRGIVLREIAKHNINSLSEFQSLEIEGLQIKEIIVVKNKTEIIYNIVE
ncbi:MAG: YaaA family protein [Epsilonproteobacteria bacterium]|nr:YaaA family protein [Campylobacterota bacterium]